MFKFKRIFTFLLYFFNKFLLFACYVQFIYTIKKMEFLNIEQFYNFINSYTLSLHTFLCI